MTRDISFAWRNELVEDREAEDLALAEGRPDAELKKYKSIGLRWEINGEECSEDAYAAAVLQWRASLDFEDWRGL